jgi:sugar phosphate isomerase/epimerase
MDVYFGAQPILLGDGLDLNDANESERQRAIDAVRGGIDEAHEIGAKGVALLSGKYTEDSDDALKRLVYEHGVGVIPGPR